MPQNSISFGMFSALVPRACRIHSIVRVYGLYIPCALLLADDLILAGLAVISGIAKDLCFAPHVLTRVRTASSYISFALSPGIST